MTDPGGADISTDAYFADALIGSDGMSEPPPSRRAATVFADPLAAPAARSVDAMRLLLPQVPVPPVTAEAIAAQAAQQERIATAARREVAMYEAKVRETVTQRTAAGRSVPPPAPTGAGYVPASWAPPSAGHGSSYPVVVPGRPQQVRPQQARPQQPTSEYRAFSSPVHGGPARPAIPPRHAGSSKRSSGGILGFLVVVVLFLMLSGAGREILDVIMDVLNQ